jgi:hypothetical protein
MEKGSSEYITARQVIAIMNRLSVIQLIEQYIESWKRQDLSLCLSTLALDIVVAECYGPVYHGTEEIRRWFTDWHASPRNGKVTEWKITNIIFDETKDMAAVEWDFGCMCDGKAGSFLGSSLFYFDDSKIVRIHEYQMDKKQYTPYRLA